MKTFSLKGNDVKEHWHVLDAAERPLGRLATDIVRLLRGKHRPTYTPHLDNGDHVIVVNASKIRVTGSKMQQKVYRRHSGYPGGLKETPIVRMLELHPERIVQQAVKGMLPHNRLGRKLLKHMKVYGGPDHPHEAQVRAGMAKSSTATPQIAAKKQDAEEPVEAVAASASAAPEDATEAKE